MNKHLVRMSPPLCKRLLMESQRNESQSPQPQEDVIQTVTPQPQTKTNWNHRGVLRSQVQRFGVLTSETTVALFGQEDFCAGSGAGRFCNLCHLVNRMWTASSEWVMDAILCPSSPRRLVLGPLLFHSKKSLSFHSGFWCLPHLPGMVGLFRSYRCISSVAKNRLWCLHCSSVNYDLCIYDHSGPASRMGMGGKRENMRSKSDEPGSNSCSTTPSLWCSDWLPQLSSLKFFIGKYKITKSYDFRRICLAKIRFWNFMRAGYCLIALAPLITFRSFKPVIQSFDKYIWWIKVHLILTLPHLISVTLKV